MILPEHPLPETTRAMETLQRFVDDCRAEGLADDLIGAALIQSGDEVFRALGGLALATGLLTEAAAMNQRELNGEARTGPLRDPEGRAVDLVSATASQAAREKIDPATFGRTAVWLGTYALVRTLGCAKAAEMLFDAATAAAGGMAPEDAPASHTAH